MKGKTLIGVVLVMLAFASCRDKELDMTVMQKTVYEGATMNEITAEDAWTIRVVQDSVSYVELEYSAFLEEYLKVALEGSSLQVGFKQHLYLPSNTVMNATIHTPTVHKLSFSDAVFASLDGLRSVSDLTLELDDAATCRGGHCYGNANLKLSDASTCIEFYFEGTNCTMELDDASVFKGSLYVDGNLTMSINDASRLTNYWSDINHVEAIVSDASYLNMATNWISTMHLEVKNASEATVNVIESLEGIVHDASKLYYSGHPTLNVDCDGTSILQQVDYPNP